MPTALLKLPVELIGPIIDGLEPSDLSSLRLTCQHLNSIVLGPYCLSFFATLETNLTAKSVKRLKNISSVQHLAASVKVLHIACPDSNNLGQGFHWRRNLEGGLMIPPGGLDDLRAIVSKLIDCRTFQISMHDEFQIPCDEDNSITKRYNWYRDDTHRRLWSCHTILQDSRLRPWNS